MEEFTAAIDPEVLQEMYNIAASDPNGFLFMDMKNNKFYRCFKSELKASPLARSTVALGARPSTLNSGKRAMNLWSAPMPARRCSVIASLNPGIALRSMPAFCRLMGPPPSMPLSAVAKGLSAALAPSSRIGLPPCKALGTATSVEP